MPLTVFKRLLNFTTHRIFNLPVVVMMPHSRCNCRCVMCDIWKANHDQKELSVELLKSHVHAFVRLGVREIVFSGGEALMHSNLWQFASLLRQKNIKLTLLSTGLLITRNAEAVVKYFDGVIVSLDGSESVHDSIRKIPSAYSKLAEGVRSLKEIDRDFPVSARCVLQKLNYSDFPNIIESAKALGLDRISFLTADVSSDAFNRMEAWSREKVSDIVLDADEAEEFGKIVEKTFHDFSAAYKTRFIAESPDKMRKLVQYYKALNGDGNFPNPVCNAPWVSAVIESDGSVAPCFFHKPYGNLYDKNFEAVINSSSAISFRRSLNMSRDETCRKCVCSLKIGMRQFN